MAFGLTANGLATQTQSEIFDELAARVQAQFGTNTNVDISSIMGQWINITAEVQALDQSELLAVWRRFDPNSAEGVALNALAALTGSVRRGATSSVVDGLAEFSGAGTLPNGSLIRNEDNSTTWELINGPLVFAGPGTLAAIYRAVDTGPILANAVPPTTWSVVTVVPGFVGFTNPTDDATIGQNEESDEGFRRRRQRELYSQNIGPLLSIQGVVSKVNTSNGRVTDVRVYHNPAANPADTDGIPFKAFNVVVETDPPLPLPQIPGPTNPLAQDIADAIFSATGAGGESYGTSYGDTTTIPLNLITVTDAEDQAQGPIEFDVVEDIDIFIDIDIEVFSNNDDGPVVPSDPQQMADLIRSTVATSLTGAFVQLGRDARALDTSGVIQSLILDGELSGIKSAIVGVNNSGAPAALAISSVALAAGTGADFTTAAPHGLAVGSIVVQTGFTDPTYNGVFTVTAIPGASTYEIAAITFSATSTGAAEVLIAGATATITIRQKPDYDTGNIRVFIDGGAY
jgi:hypothetical protein